MTPELRVKSHKTAKKVRTLTSEDLKKVTVDVLIPESWRELIVRLQRINLQLVKINKTLNEHLKPIISGKKKNLSRIIPDRKVIHDTREINQRTSSKQHR